MTSNLTPECNSETDLNKRIAKAMGGVWKSARIDYTNPAIQIMMLEDLVEKYTHVGFANNGKMITPSNTWEYDKHVTQHGLNLKESIAIAWLAMKEETNG